MTTHLANDPVDADNAVTNGPEERERKNLASPLEMALNATQNGKEGELDRFFSVLAVFNTKPTPSNLVQEVTQSIPSSTGTSLQVGATGCFRITSTTKKSTEKPEEMLLGESSFNDAARPSSIDIGFTPFYEKNLGELRGPLPLTIFNKVWQDRVMAYASSKQARKEDKSDDKSKCPGIG
ncbi:hypothetical protein Pst134EA_021124 [Puccinia striiformis f. sp. tritici]|uniref:hypothetical protein n=1 Tax=Puccinia striiformis f. sp. tritici TaxID=168172 RepID=UPI0020080661|nr:hypothetical protein Pst134EA_021124 [Puccinia striiformis f. sp. tritici]KAH9457241.1 hypothetical protein Pst134EA_021124 [Puccinia striiformis f. sp. tritici]